MWNGLTFNFETILQAHDHPICAMKFTHSGAYLASSDKNGVIKYFEPNMNNLTAWQGSSSKEAIRGISFSPDDRRFATASDDSSIRIWSFAESTVESVLTGLWFSYETWSLVYSLLKVMGGMSSVLSGIPRKVSLFLAAKITKSNSGIQGQGPFSQLCRLSCLFFSSGLTHLLQTLP